MLQTPFRLFTKMNWYFDFLAAFLTGAFLVAAFFAAGFLAIGFNLPR
jgi:hypothetical protein